MKTILYLLCLSFLLQLPLAMAGKKKKEAPPVSPEAEATYKDIKNTLGSVPTFLKEYQESAISGAWLDMKSLQLNPNTAISGKYKELIGLAVSAQIPCKYCTYFHTKASALNAASPVEQKEAIAVAACSRRWSTVLNGNQQNLAAFKKDVDKAMAYMNKRMTTQAMEERIRSMPMDITTSAQAYKDIELYFGFIPGFLKNYPQDSIAGAWREFKAVELNPDSAIPGKYKHLMALAVSAQIPCSYCTYFHTKAALSNGATQVEIKEAVAMAGLTRSWSTVLNGENLDPKKFEKETDAIMKFTQKKMSKQVSQN